MREKSLELTLGVIGEDRGFEVVDLLMQSRRVSEKAVDKSMRQAIEQELLGGSWSSRTVAGWVDEVLRPSAAACDDGEDFRLKDVA